MMTNYRLRIIAVLAGLLLMMALPATAQEEPPWTAWLYNRDTGQIILVDEAGTVIRDIQLPLAQAFNAYGPSIVVSPSGTHVLFSASDTTASALNAQLFVYDMRIESLVAAYPLAPDTLATNLQMNASAAIFDEESSRVALGIYMAGAATGAPVWHIVILNYRLGEPVATLVASDAPPALNIQGEVVPLIQRHDDGQVSFIAVPYNTPYRTEYPAYTWTIDTGAVEQDIRYISAGTHILPATGEAILPLYDDRLPAAQLPRDTISRLVNTLHVVDADGRRYPFYNETEDTIIRAYFIQNGERVLVQAYDDVTYLSTWRVLERDGSAAMEAIVPDSARRIYATPDGFAYTIHDAATALIHVATRADAPQVRTVWTGPEGRQVELYHVAYMPSELDAEVLIPWAQLADPVTGD